MADHVTRSKQLARSRRKVQERMKAMQHKPVKLWMAVSYDDKMAPTFGASYTRGDMTAQIDKWFGGGYPKWRLSWRVVPVLVQRLK